MSFHAGILKLPMEIYLPFRNCSRCIFVAFFAGSPIFLASQLVFYGMNNDPLNISIPFYSDPSVSLDGVDVQRVGHSLSKNLLDDCNVTVVDTVVQMVHYGVNVQRNGQTVIFAIGTFNETETGTYILRLTNSKRLHASLHFQLAGKITF